MRASTISRTATCPVQLADRPRADRARPGARSDAARARRHGSSTSRRRLIRRPAPTTASTPARSRRTHDDVDTGLGDGRRAAVDRGASCAQRQRPMIPGKTRRHRLRPLLALLQLASPALPVGGFAYSQGLESAIERGVGCTTRRRAQRWIGDLLTLVLARFEAPLWLRLHDAALAQRRGRPSRAGT